MPTAQCGDPPFREILCFYANRTVNPQIVQVTNMADWQLQRVVFPGQSILFQAPLEAVAEVLTFTKISIIRSDQVPCQNFQVSEELIASLLNRLI